MGKASDLFRADRYKSWARQHASDRSFSTEESKGGDVLPTYNKTTPGFSKTGGVGENHNGRGSPPGSAASQQQNAGEQGGNHGHQGGGYFSGMPEASSHNDVEDQISRAAPPPAPPPHKSEDASAGNPTIDSACAQGKKPPITTRMIAGSKRFVVHMKDALLHSWVNVLLVFVPLGIVVKAIGLSAGIIFGMNAVAIIPLAGMLAYATESVAIRLGDTLGALLNVSFGNAVELIIFIIALVKDEVPIVQASILGSILANLLLILGMAFLFGGLRYQEQVYNSTVTQMSACLLSLSVMSLLLPTAFHASFNNASAIPATKQVLKVSRGTSVVLLIVYFLYLLFQLKSHAYLYESTPQEVIDEESHPGVFADIMNSSSSSDDSSTSESSDSDTSGSVTTARKRIKRAFKNRRRRKSSASTSSATASAGHSALSSPSTTERQGNYWENHINSQQNQAPRSGSTALGAIASGDEGDAETEANRRGNGPRVRDFVQSTPNVESAKNSDQKKHRKKHHKKYHRKNRRHEEEEEQKKADDTEIAILDDEKVESPPSMNVNEPKVNFADDVEMVGSENQASDQASGRLAFNMRQFAPRSIRPTLPKYLSNNVFVSQNPQSVPAPTPAPRPLPTRSHTTGNMLRRASSLPDRLNKHVSTSSSSRPTVSRSDPLPPFQHQRQQMHRLQSREDEGSDVEKHEGKAEMSRTAAIVLLLSSTALVAVCAEFMVDAIPQMIASSNISQAFVGLIILPIVGNAAEHVTAVTVASKNKMDLAIGVAVGSSIQIALFVTPVIVLLGWILDTNMSLYFNLFETISLFVTAFVVNFLVLDGRSNYLEGSLLIAAYVIIALGAFFYPAAQNQSAVGGAGDVGA